MVLNPNWQFLRFEFFDRFYGHSDHQNKRIGIPSIMLEGFRNKKAAAGKNAKPDTQSNWMSNEADPLKSAQALPWIIQKKASWNRIQNQIKIFYCNSKLPLILM